MPQFSSMLYSGWIIIILVAGLPSAGSLFEHSASARHGSASRPCKSPQFLQLRPRDRCRGLPGKVSLLRCRGGELGDEDGPSGADTSKLSSIGDGEEGDSQEAGFGRGGEESLVGGDTSREHESPRISAQDRDSVMSGANDGASNQAQKMTMQWQKAAKQADSHARGVKERAAKEYQKDFLQRKTQGPNLDTGLEDPAKMRNAASGKNTSEGLDYEFEAISDDKALRGIFRDSESCEQEGAEDEEHGRQAHAGDSKGVELGTDTDSDSVDGWGWESAYDEGGRSPAEERGGGMDGKGEAPRERSAAGEDDAGCAGAKDGVEDRNAYKAGLESDSVIDGRLWHVGEEGEGAESSDDTWPCSECGTRKCTAKSAFWEGVAARKEVVPSWNPETDIVPKRGKHGWSYVAQRKQQSEDMEESDGMPSSDDFIGPTSIWCPGSEALGGTGGVLEGWDEVGGGTEMQTRGSSSVEDDDGHEERRPRGSCGFQSCSSVLEYLKARPKLSGSTQHGDAYVFVGRIGSGMEGSMGASEAERRKEFLRDRVPGVVDVSYVCCARRDPRLLHLVVPRRVLQMDGVGKGLNADPQRGLGADELQNGYEKDVRGLQEREGGRGEEEAAGNGKALSVQSKCGSTLRGKGVVKEEESDVVEEREDAAERWLASVGVPLSTVAGGLAQTVGENGSHGQETRSFPDRESAQALDLLKKMEDSSSAGADDRFTAAMPLGGSELGRADVAFYINGDCTQDEGEGDRVSASLACNHSAAHQGYILVQANTSEAAGAAMRCLGQEWEREAGKETARRRASYSNCSRGYSGSMVLCAAIRACSSRPQLVRLLLPFLASPSALVSDTVSFAGNESRGSGGRMSEIQTKGEAEMSKAAAAVACSRKGIKLDGETCALALRRLSALPPFPQIKTGQSWHAKLRRAIREGPKMPELVDSEWRPRDKAHMQQQVMVAALLQRTLDVSKMTRTFALASVLHVITRLRERYLELPAGFDPRYPRDPSKASPTGGREGVEDEGFREYGWPGLVFQVWQRLSTMRHGTVFECYSQISRHMAKRYALRYRGQRQGIFSEGHDMPWRQRRRLDRYSASPCVPGRLLAGNSLVQGAYTARTGGAASLRVWLARCQGVPEHELPYRRAPVSDEVLMAHARSVDAEIRRREKYNFARHAMDYFATTNRTLALEKARGEGLMPPSEAGLTGMGSVRTPLETFWINDYTFPTPITGPDPNDAIEAWRPDGDITRGLKDPLMHRWRTNRELPPYVEPEQAVHRPGGLPRTSFAFVQQMVTRHWAGEPYINCFGGLLMPDNETAAALLASFEPTGEGSMRTMGIKDEDDLGGPNVTDFVRKRIQRRRKRAAERRERERERREARGKQAPTESHLVNPDAWLDWMLSRHERVAASRGVSVSYLKTKQEEEWASDEDRDRSSASGVEAGRAGYTSRSGAEKRQGYGKRSRRETEGQVCPEPPHIVYKNGGLEEWERNFREERIAEHMRNARLANVSITAEVRELLPLLCRRRVTKRGAWSKLPRDQPRVTEAGFRRELEILKGGDLLRLRGAGKRKGNPVGVVGQAQIWGALRLRGGGGLEDGSGGNVEARKGEASVRSQVESRQRQTVERAKRFELELAAKSRGEGRYEEFFMGPEAWSDKMRRVMDALCDFENPLHKRPKKQRVELAEDMTDILRGYTVPEWVVMRAIRKHHWRKARALAAAAADAAAHTSSTEHGQGEQAAAAAADPAAATRQEREQGGDDDHLTVGVHYFRPDPDLDDADMEADSDDPLAWPPPADRHEAEMPWLGWEQWDWDARAWGTEMERDALPPASDHDEELTTEALHELVVNEKLMLAVEAQECEEVEVLVAAGARVNYFDSEFSKCCPLHVAAAHEDPETLQTLLDLGADPSVVDVGKSTPLHRAAACGLEAHVDLLLAAGASVTVADAQGRTPLHLAAGWGRTEMVRKLVALGANVSAVTPLGDSALHAAAAWGREEAAEALLDGGAGPGPVNRMFVTPLDLAREYNYSGLVRLLLARGAVDVDRSYASWDEMWMLLEKAVAAGEMGDGYEPFNSSDVRRDFATMHSMLEQMKTEDGPHAEFLRWCDEHRQLISELHIPDQAPEEEVAQADDVARTARRRPRGPKLMSKKERERQQGTGGVGAAEEGAEELGSALGLDGERLQKLRSADPSLAAYYVAMFKADNALDKSTRAAPPKRNLSGKLIATRAAGKHGTKPHKSVEDTVKHQHDRGASHKNERASESREYLRDSRYSLL